MIIVLFLVGWAGLTKPARPLQAVGNPLTFPGERHLGNIKQLTFGGENAEAYFSPDGRKLIFQSTRDGHKCDQIYTMNLDGSQMRLVSNGKGHCTCGYFFSNGKRIIYASTYLAGAECPPAPNMAQGYVWALYKSYDIFSAKADGSDIKRLTRTDGYDAECTISPDGKRIVFTSVRDGDLDIYSMKLDGSDVKRLTNQLGYDGGAFYTPDNRQIVYRAHHPTEPKEVEEYQTLLKQGLLRPRKLEIYMMKADGSDQRQVTRNGAANFAPYMHPDGKRIIFASNMDDPKQRNFELYMINADGTAQERITYCDVFDGFPQFSPDGKKLVWASNRNGKVQGETNVFLADWIP
ncbi:MAG: PD40 domain-containing protein [Acidobacteria bacterium]|nr:PD40 domain-containing protein [Acidobacteriota bacterium]MBI3654909.1 PD40 domain-containing protein [Acidobacteriota bacterium]